jgi:hypothetical protein
MLHALLAHAVIIKISRRREGGIRGGGIREGGYEGIILCFTLRNILIRSATYSCIIELLDYNTVQAVFRVNESKKTGARSARARSEAITH